MAEMDDDESANASRTIKTMTASELKPIIEINSILYIAQHLIKNPEKMLSYLSTTYLKTARSRLLNDYDSSGIMYTKPKKEPKQQKTIIEDLKALLELATYSDPRTKLYHPHPKDGAVVFKSPAVMGLDQVKQLTSVLIVQLENSKNTIARTLACPKLDEKLQNQLNTARFCQALFKDSEKYRFVWQFSQKRGPVEFDGFTVDSTVLPLNRR